MIEEEINGVGPAWFPKRLREVLTKFSLVFFDTGSWHKHDIAYTKGGYLKDKIVADLQFLKDLLKETSRKKLPITVLGIPLAFIYFLSVLLFGFSAYNFIYL